MIRIPWPIRLIPIAILLAACTTSAAPIPVAPLHGLPQGAGPYPWWNEAVFYEIFVRSFYDSDGDGIGDFNGLIQKLDYLNDGDPNTQDDLGVSGLWLMPIYPTVSYHGFDVTDYYAVNPEYGSMQDFQRLLEEAHQRGLRVVIDLPLNHTSSQHPWFQAAQEPQSEYRDWYVWSESKPGGNGWHLSPSGYYFGAFDVGMPDLNYNHPAVTQEMENVTRFWLEEVGVDGFRLDAAKHLIEQGSIQTHSQATHAWYKEFRRFYKALSPQAMTVGEVWDNSVTASNYVTSGDELDLVFDFDLAQAMITSARAQDARKFASTLARDLHLFLGPDNLPGQFATFLTNHDQPRTMTLLEENADKAKVAASLLLTTPGVPFIYYGEEIGMLGKKPDEMIRTPMQWSAEAQAGFTSGVPWEAPNDDYTKKNVTLQTKDPTSLLAHYRNLVFLRNQHLALRSGDYLPLQVCQSSVFAFLRVVDAPPFFETVLVAVNLSDEPVLDCDFNLAQGPLAGEYRAVPLLNLRNAPLSPSANAQGGLDTYQPLPELPPYSTLILQLQPAEK